MSYNPTSDILYIECPTCFAKIHKPCFRDYECGCGTIELAPHSKRIKEALKSKRSDLDYNISEAKRLQLEVTHLEKMLGKKGKVVKIS